MRIYCIIHGLIPISPIAKKVIDNPYFQRLREIKQLGIVSYIYPGAVHTRFEHSIGTYYVADQLIQRIQQLYPNRRYYINILKHDIILDELYSECIKIAALCHDLGHGPFSHVWDDIILPITIDKNIKLVKHENRSIALFQLIYENYLKDDLTPEHVLFISSLIKPSTTDTGPLYQIVNNYLNGLDVDKMDYLLRDTFYIFGRQPHFDYKRLISDIIIDDNNNIAYSNKNIHDIYQLYHTRFMLHRQAYSHKTVKKIEYMFSDILKMLKLDNNIYIDIDTFNTQFYRYTDSYILYKIKECDQSNKLYNRIIHRDLYKYYNYREYNGDDKCAIYGTYKIGYTNDNNPFDKIYIHDGKKSDIINREYFSPLINDKTFVEEHFVIIPI